MEIEHKSSQDTIEIRDLGLAAALVSAGCFMTGSKRNQIGRVFFVFKNDEDVRAAVAAWQTNELEVSARSYFQALKSLKDIIYNERFS